MLSIGHSGRWGIGVLEQEVISTVQKRNIRRLRKFLAGDWLGLRINLKNVHLKNSPLNEFACLLRQ